MTPPENQLLVAARATVRAEAAAVDAVAQQLDATFLAVYDLLLACEGKVFIAGSGTSGTIARRMAHLLSLCGTPSAFLHPMDALHGTMGVLAERDVLISISRGGETAELNELMVLAKRRGVQLVALTSSPGSTMARLADIAVQLDIAPGADPGDVIAMGSTLMTAVWGDALALLLMRQRGYTWAQLLETHPGGAVGQIDDAPDDIEPIN